MLDHVSIGVRDLTRTQNFYDAALAPLGYGAKKLQFWAAVADRPVPADMESGLHFCFGAPSRTSVDAFHAAALKVGGKDNGAPGLREKYGPNYYAAFVIDPDGYRLEAYCSAEA